MKLRDPQLLADYLVKRQFSQARIARYADCSRQFINQLVKGKVDTCSVEVGTLIEEALDLLPGTLFVRMESLPVRENIVRGATSAEAPGHLAVSA